jgi:hypothetical protein
MFPRFCGESWNGWVALNEINVRFSEDKSSLNKLFIATQPQQTVVQHNLSADTWYNSFILVILFFFSEFGGLAGTMK